MRDRLIELLEKYPCMSTAEDCFMESISSDLADYLIANGVIVPQCNFKDTIYRIGSKNEIYGDWELMYIQVYPDEILYVDDSDNYFTAEDIGKTVFLTKEEAEKALKERNKNESIS